MTHSVGASLVRILPGGYIEFEHRRHVLIAPLPAPAENPTPQLSTALEADWACVWLSLRGELVGTTIPAFERVLGEAISLDRRKIVLLTIGLSNADAAGLAAIDRAKEMARARGIKMAVRSTRRSRTERPELSHMSQKSRVRRHLPTQWWPPVSAAMRRPEQVAALRLRGSD
jgi:anti-anti-sigma regulatory factor